MAAAIFDGHCIKIRFAYLPLAAVASGIGLGKQARRAPNRMANYAPIISVDVWAWPAAVLLHRDSKHCGGWYQLSSEGKRTESSKLAAYRKDGLACSCPQRVARQDRITRMIPHPHYRWRAPRLMTNTIPAFGGRRHLEASLTVIC